MSRERCQVTHPQTGTQCGKPAGHTELHGNGTLCSPWSTLEKIIQATDPATSALFQKATDTEGSGG